MWVLLVEVLQSEPWPGNQHALVDSHFFLQHLHTAHGPHSKHARLQTCSQGDFEHVASLFPDIQANLPSVGLILTSHPRRLRAGVAAQALFDTKEALEGLVNSAVEHEHGSFPWHKRG